MAQVLEAIARCLKSPQAAHPSGIPGNSYRPPGVRQEEKEGVSNIATINLRSP